MENSQSEKSPEKLQKKMEPVREAITKRAKSIIKTYSSLRDFQRKTGIPYATLQHWTDIHKNGLPESSISEFITALKAYGIECTHEWMMYGTGVGPKKVGHFSGSGQVKEVKKRAKKNRSEANQTSLISAAVNIFLQWDKDAVEYVVSDDAMEPRFTRGEVVVGLRRYGEDINTLLNQDCIILIEKGGVCLRTLRQGNLPGHFHLAHTNLHTTTSQPFLSDVKVVSAAPVIWAMRKDIFD